MSNEPTQAEKEEILKKWVNDQVNAAVRELMDSNLFESVLVEARPAWVFPFGLVIGMAREQGQGSDFAWFITGSGPIATAHSSVAETPREAARHFALQWQLEARRLEDLPEAEPSTVETLIERAQALYELTEQDNLWQS